MRAGPPGRTAADRNQTRVMDQTPLSMGQARPGADEYLGDEAEAWIEQRWQEMRDAGHPVSKRSIRHGLLCEWAREAKAQAIAEGLDEDPAAVLTYRRRNGEVSRSVPVDGAVGERVAAGLP